MSMPINDKSKEKLKNSLIGDQLKKHQPWNMHADLSIGFVFYSIQTQEKSSSL